MVSGILLTLFSIFQTCKSEEMTTVKTASITALTYSSATFLADALISNLCVPNKYQGISFGGRAK